MTRKDYRRAVSIIGKAAAELGESDATVLRIAFAEFFQGQPGFDRERFQEAALAAVEAATNSPNR